MARITLRDDDLNATCSPCDAQFLYDASAHFDTVVLSVIPNLSSQAVTWRGSENFARIVDNKPLVRFIAPLLARNVTLSMHGLTHAGYAEFSRPVSKNAFMAEKNKLEDEFQVQVDTFTAPNNSLSRRNYELLKEVGIRNIIGCFGSYPWERPLKPQFLSHFIRSSILAISRKKSERILGGVRHGSSTEYHAFTAYNHDEVVDLARSVHASLKRGGGDIYIATHFWEIWRSDANRLLSTINRLRTHIQ